MNKAQLTKYSGLCSTVKGIFTGVVAALCLMVFASRPAEAAQGVVSLDMCADEYVLGLLPDQAIMALSPRAGLRESFYADRVRTHRRIRPSLETLLALKPSAVIRTYGGDISLINALKQRGVNIIQINDVNTFPQARSELLRVGGQLGAGAAAQLQAQAMDQALSDLVKPGRGRSALYYTPSGYSAGHDTWAGQLVETLGFRLMARSPGYDYISPEAFLSLKPDVYAIGFYDDAFGARHAPGRHPLVRDRLSRAVTFNLPSTVLACSGWYAAFGLKGVGQPTLIR